MGGVRIGHATETLSHIGSMKPLRKIWAVLAVAAGWWLSPLTWWNDAFVNLPIAWLVASLFAHGNKTALLIGVNIVYWATNVLGFLLMHWGGSDLLGRRGDEAKKPTRRAVVLAVVWSLVYSAVVTALILLGVISPLSL